MKDFTSSQIDEMHLLMTRLGEDRMEESLKTLEKAFRQWKKGTMSFSEIDGLIVSYSHIKESQVHTDPVVTIADALAERKLERDMISDDLYNKIEIVVRLMKN